MTDPGPTTTDPNNPHPDRPTDTAARLAYHAAELRNGADPAEVADKLRTAATLIDNTDDDTTPDTITGMAGKLGRGVNPDQVAELLDATASKLNPTEGDPS